MEQRIRLYRKHTGACLHGYTEPLFEGENKLPDCKCPINGEGYLRNELGKNGKPQRIRHRGLDSKDWHEANGIREKWLAWGRTTEPGINFVGADPTIEEAIKAFNEYQTQTETAGKNTKKKYKVLFNRLRAFAKIRGLGHISQFGQVGNPAIVNGFFMSWTNLRNPIKPMSLNTKRAELERFKSFMERCKKNAWIQYNHAADIKMGKTVVAQKFAFTKAEYERIMETFNLWEDEYGRMDTPKAQMAHAFALCLRYTGQRISDVAMLGPSNIVQDGEKFYIGLTQIKTGKYVQIPVPESLVSRLRALAFRGTRAEAFALKCQGWTITYPAQGYWFWTGASELDGNANNWSMDVKRVLDKCEDDNGKFEHNATAHTFRHFFAITMLQSGVSMEMVSRWLGHSSVIITSRHYAHANADYNNASYEAYMAAMDKLEPKAKKATGKLLAMRKAG